MSSDLELEIGAGLEPYSYQVRVVHAAAGGEPTAALQLDVAGLLSRRDTLEATVLASAVPARRVTPAAEQPVHEVGQALFDAVFTGPVNGTYRASLGVAQQRGERLRVVLRLTAPELAVLPWEALMDPETGSYLCRQEPLVRHVPAPYTPDPLQASLPLRILGLVASPRGLPLLDVEAEQRHLTQALATPIESGMVELTWVPEATWAAVHERLLSGQWHVLHFVGHGDYDARTEEGLLALVGADGRADMVEASRLADLLGEARPTPRLVVLNSCSSGQAGTQDLFSGTAAALVHSGISAVAAMQFSVSDTAAIAFSRGFYTALAHGRDVDEAARSGRIEILGARGTLEWVTPVLYVRGEATRLFSFSAPASLSTMDQSGPHPPPAPPGQRVGTPPSTDRDTARRLLPLLVVALLVVALAAAYLLGQVGNRGGTTADTAGSTSQVRPSVTSSPEASTEPGTTNPTAGGSPVAPALTADQRLENFVKSYYSEVTKDTSRTWVLLTPSMQSVSGSRDGYASFWRTIDRVQVSQIVPNASGLKAVVTLTIVGKDGKTLIETHQFTFVKRGGNYLIDSEKVLG